MHGVVLKDRGINNLVVKGFKNAIENFVNEASKLSRTYNKYYIYLKGGIHCFRYIEWPTSSHTK